MPRPRRRDAARHVSVDSRQHVGAAPVEIEAFDVQPELARIAPKIVVLEGMLALEEQLMHPPEPALQRGRLGRGRGCEGVDGSP